MTVHDDQQGSWPPGRRGHVTIDLGREGVAVTTPDGGHQRVSIAEHREAVVRRLLQRGLSPRALSALLPEFRTLIDRFTRS